MYGAEYVVMHQTAQDIARDFARTSMTQSAAEIYAHHLHTCAYNFTGKLYAELIRGVPTDRLRTIYVVRPEISALPAMRLTQLSRRLPLPMLRSRSKSQRLSSRR